MKKIVFCLIAAMFLGCAAQKPNLEDTAGAFIPPPRLGTAAELSAGTETGARSWAPKTLSDRFSGAAAEVVDATVGAAGDTDTAHSYSKDDIHDYVAQHDADFDGLPDGVENSSITDAMLNLTTPALGTPSALVGTNITGVPVSTGVSGLGAGVAAALANAPDAAGGLQSVLAEGAFAAGDKTKLDGIETAADVTDATNVAAAGALMTSSLGANVATALGIAIGSAGAPVLFDGAGGTPSSLTLTNATGLPVSSVISGTTSLNESTAADDSGAYIIGCFDDFTNSDSTNVQGVLKDFDGAISSPTQLTLTDSADADATWYLWMSDGATGAQAAQTDSGVTVNPFTNVITAGGYSSANQDDPTMSMIPSTASDSSWYFGVNHDSEGDDDDPLEWRQSATPGSSVGMSLSASSFNLTIAGDLIVTGDDLFMNTNTDGMILVADGTNFNPVQVSGDVEIDNTGATTIQAGAVDPAHLSTVTDDVGVCWEISNGGSAIASSQQGWFEIPQAFTISSVTMLADQSGSIVVDLWVDTYGNYPPTDADTITASAVPTISAATASQDTTLTGWTTAVSKGSILKWNVDSASTVTVVTMCLKGDI